MFENLLGQSAKDRLIEDIGNNSLAPAMLFLGPSASGKGTAALELGRALSCEAALLAEDGLPAAWNCSCPACSRHRRLLHPDLLCLGWRPFSAEIAASAGAFLRDPSGVSSRILFMRSVRKLLARFNPVLWEDEAKGAKVLPLAGSLEEELDELEALTLEREKDEAAGNPDAAAGDPSATDEPSKERKLKAKLVEGILKNAFKLESEGVSEAVPIGQIKRAAFWSRLAPSGREKLVVIENADRMQEGAQNSLLKLLEEPPARSRFVLCASRPGGIPRTVLSRLRPYRFFARDAEAEGEVIRRVFRDRMPEGLAGASAQGRRIGAYLDSFLPVSGDTLKALAAFFAASAAYKAALLAKRQGRSLSEELLLLGKFCAPKAEDAGLGRPQGGAAAVSALVLEKAEKFEIRALFSRFLRYLLEQVSESLRAAPAFTPAPAYNELWRKCSLWAETAAGVYNLRPAQVLEKFFTDLSGGMAGL